MSKETYIPISELNDFCANRVNLDINIDLPLPYSLDEKIEIDIRKINTLRQIGGFRSISITRDNESGVSQSVPQIDGINFDGSAISTKANKTTVPKGSFDIKDNEKDIHMINRAKWPDLNIKINVEEIQQKILNKKETNVQDQTIWGNELDKITKRVMAKAATKHLMNIYSIQDWAQTTAYSTSFLSLIINKEFGSILFSIGLLNTVNAITTKKDYRPSLILGPEIERTIAFNIYSRLGNLIRSSLEGKESN